MSNIPVYFSPFLVMLPIVSVLDSVCPYEGFLSLVWFSESAVSLFCQSEFDSFEISIL